MAYAKLPEAVIAAIKAAPAKEEPAELAGRLSQGFEGELERPLSASTVKKYRAEGRGKFREVAREELARHGQEHPAGALDDLTELR